MSMETGWKGAARTPMPAHSGAGSMGSMGKAASGTITVKLKPSSSMGHPPPMGIIHLLPVANNRI
jgi:hypothetical protein